jgi:hypothetical protein
MSLKRITYNQAVKKVKYNHAELGRILGCTGSYIGECLYGTKDRKRKVYLSDKHEERYREHFGLPPRYTG